MSSIGKIAAKDAKEYARAQVFHGDGAGVRRRLIDATVNGHLQDYGETYEEAFNKALEQQDWSEHVVKAVRERKRIDKGKYIERNVRGLIRGNRQSLTTGVAIAAAVGIYAHQTGYDKIAFDMAKKEYQKGKAWASMKYRMHKANMSVPDSPEDL